jgi:hypothetical protein
VFRPRRARLVVYICAAALVVTLVALALALPHGHAHSWGTGSRLALVGLALVVSAGLHRLADVRIETDETGVTVVNVVGRRRLEWAQIVGVRLTRDDSWLVLDLDDGQAMQAMGIAKSEGDAAQAQAREFARLVKEHSRVPGHD